MPAVSEDERLRELERAAAGGDPGAAMRLGAALERLGRPCEAARTLARAARDLPRSDDVAQALARLRGPSRVAWPAPLGDARKTRRSTSRGPRGQGSAIATPTEGGLLHQDERPPLIGPSGQVALARARAEEGRAVRELPLAFAADGTLYMLEDGALVAREADTMEPVFAPRDLDEHPRRLAWAAVLDDASLVIAHQDGLLARAPPWGGPSTRLRQTDLGPDLLGAALDARAGRIYSIELTSAWPPPAASLPYVMRVAQRALTAFDLSLQRNFSVDLLIDPCDPPLVADDGRIVVLSLFGRAVVVSPAGMVERELRYGERIGGARAALGPGGTLVIVAWDRAGAAVTILDLATGARVSGFHVLRGFGAPAVDADGVLYLRAGEPSRVVGHELATGREVYRLERPGVRDDQPKALALGDGEVVFVEVPEGGPPRLVRGRGSEPAG
jgi:hypothetical protein